MLRRSELGEGLEARLKQKAAERLQEKRGTRRTLGATQDILTPTNLDNSDELETFLRYLRSDRRREALSSDEIETFPFASSLIGLCYDPLDIEGDEDAVLAEELPRGDFTRHRLPPPFSRGRMPRKGGPPPPPVANEPSTRVPRELVEDMTMFAQGYTELPW